MDRQTRLLLYGSDEELPVLRRLHAGNLAIEIVAGAVRGLFWNGVEVLRGIDYPVRNPDWGTWASATLDEEFDEAGDRFSYSRRFSVNDGLFEGNFTCSGTAGGALVASLRLVAGRDTEVNRAGFVVLHPVAGVAGSPLVVTHQDGRVEETVFPEHISPSQPVFDIACLRQSANGVVADIEFRGEVFEMEDQRNWSDASYKTYCRPLALPFPFAVAASSAIEQTITINLSGAGKAIGGTAATLRLGAPTGRTIPEVTLALEPGWEATAEAIRPAATVLRLDLTDADWQDRLSSALAAVHGALDLELVVPDELDAIGPALAGARGELERRSIVARTVTALPKAYLKSFQPDALWPEGTTPTQAAAAARAAFPGVRIGGGMLSNFTELNRHRAAAEAGDFVTHGTTAIVHAADDVSVLQTLDALPQIFASAEALQPQKPYRLGLVSIGMRSNPYGAGVADNPHGRRTPMAMFDPRIAGLFGAAFMVGAVAATAESRVESLALAAPGGPLGIVGGDGPRPVFHVFAALARLSGLERLAVGAPAGIAAVAAAAPGGPVLIVANLRPEAMSVTLPRQGVAVVLAAQETDPHWLSRAPRRSIAMLELPAHAVGFVDFGALDFFGALK